MKSSEQGPSQEKPLSFAELEGKEQVSADELKATLRDYAESGAAILVRVVNSLIDRVNLTENDLAELVNIARRGIEVQEENRPLSKVWTVEREKGQYQQVINHIELRSTKD